VKIDKKSYQSPNYDHRQGRIEGITLHTGEGTRWSDLGWLCNPASNVSAHYYVCRDAGIIYQLVADERRAWHAGHAWGNDCTLGIETEHKQGQDWPEVQLEALAALCKHLIGLYDIPASGIVAHRWLTPARKIDPTDWTDSALHAWIDSLYEPSQEQPAQPGGWYRTIYPATVRTAPSVETGEIVATFAPDSHLLVSWTTGQYVRGSDQWAHLSESQIGFIHASALEAIEGTQA
jgi:hypothetical protein